MEIAAVKTVTANLDIKNNCNAKAKAEKNGILSDHNIDKRFDSFVFSGSGVSEAGYSGKDGNAVNSLYSATSTIRTAETEAKRKIIPYLLAGKISGVSVSSTGSPSINGAYDYWHWQAAMDTVKGDHLRFKFSESYVYDQTDEDKNYGYKNHNNSCATFALATALSIKNNKKITPDQISTSSSTDGHGTRWGAHGAYFISETSESKVLLGVDAQLQLGNPVLIHTVDGNKEHWATVIGKENGVYYVVDPCGGTTVPLQKMTYYKEGSLKDYVILSNEY